MYSIFWWSNIIALGKPLTFISSDRNNINVYFLQHFQRREELTTFKNCTNYCIMSQTHIFIIDISANIRF